MPRVVFGVTVPITAKAFLKGQLQELVRRRWDTYLVTSPGAEVSELEAIAGLDVHPISMKRDPSPIADLVSLRHWSRLIKRIKPDAVVLSTPKASLLGLIAGWFHRVPVRIYHVRGLRAEGTTGVTRTVSLLAERISAHLATDVVVDSPSLLTRLRELKLIKNDQGLVLGNGSSCGVDTEHFRPPTSEERAHTRKSFGIANDGTFVIGYVGRVTRDKGIPELTTAIKDICREDTNIHCIITGPIEQEDLQPLLSEPWISASKSFGDPRQTYWAADVMCFPSRREGFPIAPLEAQACGIPVVTTTAIGSIDSIQDQQTGLLVPVNEPSQLKHALQILHKDKNLRQALGRGARGWTTRNFEATSVQGRWLEFLASILYNQTNP